MDNLFDMFEKFNTDNSTPKENNNIPKEILDQYPYGQFPIRYTKSGQEIIRKQSESRFKYENENTQLIEKSNNDNKLDFNILLPIIQMLSSGKKNSKDMMQLFSKILFKDNPDFQKLFSLFSPLKGQNIEKQKEQFPNTNKVEISSLKKIN